MRDQRAVEIIARDFNLTIDEVMSMEPTLAEQVLAFQFAFYDFFERSGILDFFRQMKD